MKGNVHDIIVTDVLVLMFGYILSSLKEMYIEVKFTGVNLKQVQVQCVSHHVGR